jgi:hypothetical protein
VAAPVSLRRIDLRFAFPHEVRCAAVLGLDEWSAGLEEAGVELGREGDLDLAVAPVERASEALAVGARAVVLEGRSGARRVRRAGYAATRYLPLPSIEAPDLLLPLEGDAPVGYALETWRPADTWPKQARNRALAALARLGALPDPRPLQVLGLREAGEPATLAAAGRFGVPAGAGWFLTLGQGDALTRAVFHVFAPGSRNPGWVVKVARIPGYEEPFAKDEAGLDLVEAAGGRAFRHAPRLLGRFEVHGRHASVETAAVGERLSTLLSRDTGRGRQAFDDVTAWVSNVGAETASEGALGEELARLEQDVLPRWNVPESLLSGLEALPAVLQHNDLGTWNVVSAGKGKFTILDWESALERGLPLWDLLYFSVDALGQLDRARTAEQRAEHAVRLLRGELPASQTLFETIRRYVAELGIPVEAVGPLATLCWLHHGLSHVRRGEKLGAEAQIPPAERIAPVWMEDLLLGPDWDRWRG